MKAENLVNKITMKDLRPEGLTMTKSNVKKWGEFNTRTGVRIP